MLRARLQQELHPSLQRCEGVLHVSPDFALPSSSVTVAHLLALSLSALPCFSLPRVKLLSSCLLTARSPHCLSLSCFALLFSLQLPTLAIWQAQQQVVVLNKGASSLAVLHHHMAPNRPHCLNSGCFWGLAQLLTQSKACCCLQ